MKTTLAIALALAPSLAFADTLLTPVRSVPDVLTWPAPQGIPNPDRNVQDAHTPTNTAPKAE